MDALNQLIETRKDILGGTPVLKVHVCRSVHL